MIKKEILPYIFFILLVFSFKGICFGAQTDTPIQVLVTYFPSPAIMRCLNHSEIPNKFRKAQISRHAIFSDKNEITQNVVIGTTGKKFTFLGNITTNEGNIIPLMLNGGPYFGIIKGGEIKASLFGFENLLGLQKKVHIKDKLEKYNLDFETFLKTTKGKIGTQNYNLELTGEDRVVGGEVKYFLNGLGMIGNENIIVKGAGLQKDSYKLFEKYGNVKVFTTIKVYD